MNIVQRTLGPLLQSRCRNYKVICVTGPRQSGKTTLVRTTFPDYSYVSLENPDQREYAETDPKGFLAEYTQGVILDEVQRVPQLLSYIQGIVDNSEQFGQYILTGSNQFLLMKSISQSLAGRISLHTLLPFTISELENSPYSNNHIDTYLQTGSYPRVYDEQHNPIEWYRNYIESYIEKDLKDFVAVNDLSRFRRFLALAAGSVGQLVNLSQFGNELGLSHNTVKSWLSALEQSYIIRFVQPYHSNIKKRIVKTPKLYFYDTGLACALLKIQNPDILHTHPIRGNLFENLIIADVLKEIHHRVLHDEVFFWRDHTGNEIDCIIDKGNSIITAEIKSGKTINQSFFKGLHYFEKIAQTIDMTKFLIYGGEAPQNRDGTRIRGWKNSAVELLSQ